MEDKISSSEKQKMGYLTLLVVYHYGFFPEKKNAAQAKLYENIFKSLI